MGDRCSVVRIQHIYDDDNDGDDVDEGVSLEVLLHSDFHNPLVTNKE